MFYDVPLYVFPFLKKKKKVTIFARWQWRQRIRMYLEGTGINPTPVDLHELQLSLEQHSKAHRISTDTQSSMNHCTHCNLNITLSAALLNLTNNVEGFLGHAILLLYYNNENKFF